jgi:hypothetical protein
VNAASGMWRTIAAGRKGLAMGRGSAGLQRRFGTRVARLVESVSDDPSVGDYKQRKRQLRDRVARADPDARAIFAADKISKVRELALRPVSQHHSPKPRAELPRCDRHTSLTLQRSSAEPHDCWPAVRRRRLAVRLGFESLALETPRARDCRAAASASSAWGDGSGPWGWWDLRELRRAKATACALTELPSQ